MSYAQLTTSYAVGGIKSCLSYHRHTVLRHAPTVTHRGLCCTFGIQTHTRVKIVYTVGRDPMTDKTKASLWCPNCGHQELQSIEQKHTDANILQCLGCHMTHTVADLSRR
jgi:predicted RNA-binding Zn-ribbon protein involved in translation (DUF1610 family)